MEVYTKNADDLDTSLKELLELLSWRDVISSGDRVLIKPNFCTHLLKNGVTTNLKLLDAIIALMK